MYSVWWLVFVFMQVVCSQYSLMLMIVKTHYAKSSYMYSCYYVSIFRV